MMGEGGKEGRKDEKQKALAKVTIRSGRVNQIHGSNQVKSKCVERLHAVKRAVEMSRLARSRHSRREGTRDGREGALGCPGLALTWP
jgi:hypothetical protein